MTTLRDVRHGAPYALGSALLFVCASTVGGQERAYFSGVVVDGMTGLAIESARVELRALGLADATDAEGRFMLDGIRAGAFEVRFEASGYGSVTEELVLTGSDFRRIRLSPVASILEELLVQVGRPRISPALEVLPSDRAKSVLDLLIEMPGVAITQGGGLASGAFITIRGANSFRADLAPSIYLDGVQLDNSQMGRQSYHTLAKIPAENVARVRVLRGTAASTYSMGGANGVILVETVGGGSRSN